MVNIYLQVNKDGDGVDEDNHKCCTCIYWKTPCKRGYHDCFCLFFFLSVFAHAVLFITVFLNESQNAPVSTDLNF